MDWLEQSWGYLVLIAALVGTAFKLLQTTYAAERDRQGLKNSQLEREKLQLEVGRLRNDPQVVADRRKIYERLRLIVGEITRDAAVTRKHIHDLHEVRHDAEFRFPADVVNSIRDLLHAAVGLHVSGAVLAAGPGRAGTEDWEKHVKDNHDSLMAIAAFEKNMVAIFRPDLSL
jgi:cell division protein FtsL